LPMQVVLNREERGRIIAATSHQIERLDCFNYRVKSQSGHGLYSVVKRNGVWDCSCPDHIYRDAKCKHIWAVEFSARLREVVKPTVIDPVNIHACIYCKSERLIKWGIRRNKYGAIQKFSCKSCGRYFTINLGFERMKHNPQGITAAMQLYFSGESLRSTAKSLKLIGVDVTHQTVYNWIVKYIGLMEKYLDQIRPQTSDTWRADEMFLKVKGNPKYLYALLDDETRYWIAKEVAGDKMSREAVDYASRLFQQGKEVTGKRPLTLITDGLKAYHLAYKRELRTLKDPRTRHLTWEDGKVDNRKMEAFNGNTVRAREKVMRSLKKPDTPILTGMQIFHNYLRPNQGIDNRTPSELAGIQVNGKNKWLTLIENASQRQTTVYRRRDQTRT
jgi:transposase-like protein